jgi:hypothetical protein
MVSDVGMTLPVALVELVAAAGAAVADESGNRLVAAFSAADMFAPTPLAAPVLAPGAVPAVLEAEVVAEAVVLDVLVVVVGAALNARNRSDRLPRNCGAIKAAKFSAAVAPDSRTVDSSVPCRIGAVRRALTVAAGACVARCRQNRTAPAIKTMTRSIAQIRPFRRGGS